MIAPRTIECGRARITVVPDGRFRLDGGAMFGVVPRVVWEKRSPADAQHRVTLGLNAMVVENGGVRVLVDPGVGDHHDATFAARFGIEKPGAPNGRSLPQSLAAAGIAPESIDFVVHTHLHWDHAGAGVARAEDGTFRPRFPTARYVVQQYEWEAATHPHERNRASYRDEDFRPLATAGVLMVVDDETELAPGIRVMPVGGHSDGMQLLMVDGGGGATFVFLADLVPTRHHLDYAWIMGYDLYPMRTLEQKKILLPQAARERWLVGFAHDPDVPFGHVRLDGPHQRPVVEPA
jgi:glyoxylase-like metal-dependent hydrolase (beta-lactamase superfamily II)